MKLQTDSQSLVHGKQGFACTLSVCEDFSNERQIIWETGDVISSVLHFSTESKEYLLWGYTFKNVAKTRFLFLRVLWRCKLITFCLINTLRNENPTVVVMWSQSSVFRSIFKLNIHLWIFFYSLIIFICGWLCKCKTLLTMSLSANATDSWAASLQSCFTSGIFKMFASSFFFLRERDSQAFFFHQPNIYCRLVGKSLTRSLTVLRQFAALCVFCQQLWNLHECRTKQSTFRFYLNGKPSNNFTIWKTHLNQRASPPYFYSCTFTLAEISQTNTFLSLLGQSVFKICCDWLLLTNRRFECLQSELRTWGGQITVSIHSDRKQSQG